MTTTGPSDRVPNTGDELALLLREHDIPCARCRYNLRGTNSGACPECALPVTLERVREVLDHRRWRRNRLPSDRGMLAGMIGSLAGYGLSIGALLSAGIILGQGGRGVLSLIFPALPIAVLVQSVFVVLFVIRTERTAARPARTRRCLIVSAWALTPTLAVLYALLWHWTQKP